MASRIKDRDYKGVWSNSKKTIDLNSLNTKASYDGVCCCASGHTDEGDKYYATKSGTIIHTYYYDDLEDWFADLGPIYNRHNCYEVLGRKFKKIKDIGEEDPQWTYFLKCMDEQNNK